MNLVDPDSMWYQILSRAMSSGSGHAACVEELVKAGVDVINKVLQITVHKDYDKCLQVFIEAGVDVKSTEGASALLEAAASGRDKCVKLLINAGVKVQNENGAMSLFEASRGWYDKCVDVLLAAGVDVNVENEDGHMALGLAARGDFLFPIRKNLHKCINVFINAGADIKKRDRYGFTALLYAAENGLHTCVNRILQAGANVNVTDSKGNTALHVMFIQERWVIFPNCIRVLLAAGVHVNKINHNGESAVRKWMSGYRMEELKSLIVEAGDKFDEVINSYDNERRRRKLEVVKLLFAAGENIEAAPDEVKYKINPQTQMYLMNLCRDVIREHLLKMDPHENLFVRVRKINISEHLQKYLLFNISLDEEEKK